MRFLTSCTTPYNNLVLTTLSQTIQIGADSFRLVVMLYVCHNYMFSLDVLMEQQHVSIFSLLIICLSKMESVN